MILLTGIKQNLSLIIQVFKNQELIQAASDKNTFADIGPSYAEMHIKIEILVAASGRTQNEFTPAGAIAKTKSGEKRGRGVSSV